MNNFNFDLDNNLAYEDIDLNNKINEYNQLYNNDNYNLINSNINYNQNNYTKNNNSFSENMKNNKGKKYNNSINKNKKNKYINNHISYDNPSSSEIINLSEIESEYDTYISNLKNQLTKERQERKKKEEEAVLIQHRLIILKSQEQSKLLQLKKIKQHIDKIINNRIKAQEKLNEKLIEKKNLKNSTNSGWGGTNSFFLVKKNVSSGNFPRKSNQKNIMSSSQSNFYNPKYKNFDIEKNNENSNSGKKNYDKNTIDNSEINKKINNFNINKGPNENKKSFKQQLLERIKQDEEEKKRLEEEIARIEEEENRLMFKLNNRNKINKSFQGGYKNEG